MQSQSKKPAFLVLEDDPTVVIGVEFDEPTEMTESQLAILKFIEEEISDISIK